MNPSFPGPLDYLAAFSIVLLTGLATGFALAAHLHSPARPQRL